MGRAAPLSPPVPCRHGPYPGHTERLGVREDVVGDDQAARIEQRTREAEQRLVVVLLGIDEHEVEDVLGSRERLMRVAFDDIDVRHERVALTLGCSRAQAFWMVVFPQARRGLLTAGTLAWARSLGEFGPILVFAGTTRQHTEVLSTSVFLELSIGNLEAAVAVSMVMIAAAAAVLVLLRLFGSEVGLEKVVRP